MNHRYLVCRSLIAIVSAVMVLSSSRSLAVDCDGNQLSPEDKAVAVSLLGMEYPIGIGFEQWKERTDSRITCELFDRVDIPVDINLMPYRRGFAMMSAGKFDVMQGSDFVLKPEARCDLKMLPYRHYDLLAYYFSEERLSPEPNKPADFKEKRIAGMNSETFTLLTGLKESQVQPTQAVAHQFSILRLGRADYVIAMAGAINQFSKSKTGPEEAGRHFTLPENLDDEKEGQFFSVETPFLVAEAGLVINTKRPGMAELLNTFSAELDELQHDEKFEVLVDHQQRYLGEKKPDSVYSVEGMKRRIDKYCKGL